MADSSTVVVTHRYAVPAERVYDAWITPNQAGRFLFATRTGNILHCEIDPRVGGGFIVTDRRPNPDGDESFMDTEHRGVYIEMNRPKRLVFDFALGPIFDESTRVTIDITPTSANACQLTLTHELGDSEEAQATEGRTFQIWTNALDKLDKVLTTRVWGFRVPGSA